MNEQQHLVGRVGAKIRQVDICGVGLAKRAVQHFPEHLLSADAVSVAIRRLFERRRGLRSNSGKGEKDADASFAV